MAVAGNSNANESAAPRRVSILGATGSVGRSTLDLISRQQAAYKVVALTAQQNVDLLAAQARQFNAELAVIGDEDSYGALKAALAGSGIEAAAGPQALCEAAERPSDWLMAGTSGVQLRYYHAGTTSLRRPDRCQMEPYED